MPYLVLSKSRRDFGKSSNLLDYLFLVFFFPQLSVCFRVDRVTFVLKSRMSNFVMSIFDFDSGNNTAFLLADNE